MRWRLIVLAGGVLAVLLGTAWFGLDPYGPHATACLLSAVGGAMAAGGCLGRYAYEAGYRNRPHRRHRHHHWH